MAFADHGSLIVAGGTHWEGGQKNWLSAMHALEPQSSAWRRAGHLQAPAAYGIPLAGGFLGGSDGKAPLKEVFDFDGEKSARLPIPGLPDHLVLAAGGPMESGEVVVCGGAADAADLAGLSQKAFLLRNGAVEALPDFPGRPVGIAASAVVSGHLYLFGGAHWDAAHSQVENSSQSWCLAVKERVWVPLPPLPYAVRGVSAVKLNDEWIYLAGGYRSEGPGAGEGFTEQAFLFSTRSREFRPAKSLPVKAMVTLLVHEEYLYCLGGEDRPRSRLKSCFRLPVQALLPHD